MGLLKEIKNRTDFTEREQDIRNYILQYPEKVISMSSREVGDATYSSAAAVTRFCQKLGCKGFPDFKLRFVGSIYSKDDTSEFTDDKTKLIEKETSVSVMKKVMDAQITSIEKTKNNLPISQLAKVAAMLEKVKYIDFYAYDINVHIANYACSQLFHCNKIATTYSATNVQELNALITDSSHVPILISHTGMNGRLIEIATTLKQRGNKVILIAPSRNSKLAEICDEVLVAKSSEYCLPELDDMWTVKFITSVKFIVDILFGILFSADYDQNIMLNNEYTKHGEKTLWGLTDTNGTK